VKLKVRNYKDADGSNQTKIRLKASSDALKGDEILIKTKE
jgi:hypothetical protein